MQYTLTIVIFASFFANASIDHSNGVVLGFNSDGSYNVQEGTTTFNHVRASALHSYQIKGYAMQQAKEKAESIANYGVKGNPNLTSQINVAASTLDPNRDVVTDKGIVKAGSLPPETQVAIPFNSVFSKAPRGGNNDNNHSRSAHGTGNGGSNAQASRSAGGFSTAGSHIGGGHSGGGFSY